MKPYQRRQKAAYPYYKLATWDQHLLTWNDSKVAYTQYEAAVAAAIAVGRYRISEVNEQGRQDLDEFCRNNDGIVTVPVLIKGGVQQVKTSFPTT